MIMLKTTHTAAMAGKDAEIKALTEEVSAVKRNLAIEKTRRSDQVAAQIREVERSNKLSGRLMLAHKALRTIAESVTPGAAFAARKMAATAKAALPTDIAVHVKPKVGTQPAAH